MWIDWRRVATGLIAVLGALAVLAPAAGADCGGGDDPADEVPAPAAPPTPIHERPVVANGKVMLAIGGNEIWHLGTFGFRRLRDLGDHASGLALAGGRRLTAAWRDRSGDQSRLLVARGVEGVPLDLGPSLGDGHALQVLAAADGGLTVLEQGTASRLHALTGEGAVSLAVGGRATAVRGPGGVHVISWTEGRELVVARWRPGGEPEEIGRLPGWTMAAAVVRADGSLDAAVMRGQRLARFTAAGGATGRLGRVWLRAAQMRVATVGGRPLVAWTRSRSGRKVVYTAAIAGVRPRARRLLVARGRVHLGIVADDGRGRPVVVMDQHVPRPTRWDSGDVVSQLRLARPGRRPLAFDRRGWEDARGFIGLAVDGRRRVHVVTHGVGDCGFAQGLFLDVITGRRVVRRTR